MAFWAPRPSLYLVRLGARRRARNYLVLGRSTDWTEMCPFLVSFSIPEKHVIFLGPILVVSTWPERGNERPFSVFLLPPLLSFSRTPSTSFLITHLFLHSPLSFLWVCSHLSFSIPSAHFYLHLPFIPLISSFVFFLFLPFLSPFHISFLLCSSPYFPFQPSLLLGMHS